MSAGATVGSSDVGRLKCRGSTVGAQLSGLNCRELNCRCIFTYKVIAESVVVTISTNSYIVFHIFNHAGIALKAFFSMFCLLFE